MPIEGASQGAFDQVPNDRNSLGPAVANLTGRSADVSFARFCLPDPALPDFRVTVEMGCSG
jgi:hypothetical protein